MILSFLTIGILYGLGIGYVFSDMDLLRRSLLTIMAIIPTTICYGLLVERRREDK